MPATSMQKLGTLTPEQALCIDPASFALGGVLDGEISKGETVLVTGLGAIGLFAVQYCVALGARVVAASGFEERRRFPIRRRRIWMSHRMSSAPITRRWRKSSDATSWRRWRKITAIAPAPPPNWGSVCGNFTIGWGNITAKDYCRGKEILPQRRRGRGEETN